MASLMGLKVYYIKLLIDNGNTKLVTIKNILDNILTKNEIKINEGMKHMLIAYILDGCINDNDLDNIEYMYRLNYSKDSQIIKDITLDLKNSVCNYIKNR